MFKKEKRKNYTRKKKSFSMLEAILSVAIVSIGLVGALSLLSKSTKESMDSRDQVIAGMLAQEGTEIIRNMRDNNWANSTPTLSFNGFLDRNYDCDYSDQLISDCNIIGANVVNLKLNGNYYVKNSVAGTATKFYRRINLSGTSTNYMQVESMVSWAAGGSFQTEANCVAANKCAYTVITLSKWGE
jgi:Tfp pilus assembly protein PilV